MASESSNKSSSKKSTSSYRSLSEFYALVSSSSSSSSSSKHSRKRPRADSPIHSDGESPPEKKIKAYPEKLIRHLFPQSHEKVDRARMLTEWVFDHEHDRGASDGKCPCGHSPIRYECYIRNTKTRAITFVGTDCIQWFDGRMWDALVAAGSLMRKGVHATYVGETKSAARNLRFIISGTLRLVKQRHLILPLVLWYPIFRPKGRKSRWNMVVKRFDTPPPFVEGAAYRLWLSTHHLLAHTGGVCVEFRHIRHKALDEESSSDSDDDEDENAPRENKSAGDCDAVVKG